MFDMKNLTRLKELDENAPDSMKAFWAFDKEAFKDGAIDVLHKQLMAVAVALTTQCPYCIELHVRAARQAGANDAMLTEAAIGYCARWPRKGVEPSYSAATNRRRDSLSA